MAQDQLRGRLAGRRLAEDDHDLGALAGGELDGRLQGAARVESGTGPSREPVVPPQRRGMLCGPVAPQEFRAVGRPGRLPPAQIGKGHASPEIEAPRVAGEHGACVHIDLGHDERGRRAPGGAEDPLHVRRHRQPPAASRRIREGESRDLDGILERHELHEVERDAVRVMLEPAVALAVPRHVCLALLSDRERRRAPHLAGLVVADVEALARRVAHRIVRPRRELVLTTVDRPRIAGPRLRNLEAERRVGDDVDPRSGRPAAAVQNRDVFSPPRREAAEPVEELEVRWPRRRDVHRRRRGRGRSP